MAAEDPVYRDPEWLKDHVLDVLSFYYPECIDEERGGYIHQFSDVDGEIYDRDKKHLVGTARFVFDFSIGAMLNGPDWCLDAAAHGVDFIMDGHWDDEYGGFTWYLDGTDIGDGTKYCYGHAFVVLALSRAYEAGVDKAGPLLDDAVDIIDERFWEPGHGLCLVECSRDWEPRSYRGQNANMHMCEAMLAAYEATGQTEYLDRADRIADAIGRRFPERADGLVWEHYDEDWNHDWEYNIDDKSNFFHPWGYLAGHQVEWTKLLLALERHRERDWLLERAQHLFDRTVQVAWDRNGGGLYYTFDRDDNVIIDEKFYWVMAEAFSAAALLAIRTGDECYCDWYDRIWAYSGKHLVNDDLSIWYRVLEADNTPVSDMDKNPRVKTDYHIVGACYEAINSLTATEYSSLD